MPIDPMILDATLSTFRGMAQQIKDAGLTGEDVDQMNATLARLEELGQSLDDFNEFNGTVMQENLYGKFSDHYGKALAAKGQADQEGRGYDDSTLLNQTLDALRDSVRRLREAKQQAIDQANSYSSEESTRQTLEFAERNEGTKGLFSGFFGKKKKEEAIQDAIADDKQNKVKREELFQMEIDALYDNESLIKPIEDLIALGEEEGMTFPRFLRIQIEKGMDKAMEGSGVVRDGILFEIKMANAAMENPYVVEEKKRNLEVFDELASKVKFGVPNSLEVTLANHKIEWELEPKKIYWKNLKDRMFSLVGHLESIIIANSSVFPSYAPYVLMMTHSEKVDHAKWVKSCIPGIMKEEERLLKKYFGLDFHDIFSHEIFKWEVENYHIEYSQAYIEFLKNDVYPEVVPCEFLSSETTSKFENNFHGKSMMGNPERAKAFERMDKALDEHFGKGYADKKIGGYDLPQENAPAWDLNSFN